MNTMPTSLKPRGIGQRGVAAVEFALVSVLFFTAFLGVMEMGWIMFQWNTTAEATRSAARTAAVCDMNAVAIKQRARELLGTLQSDAEVQVSYLPAACDASNCATVSVTVQAARDLPTFNPFIPHALRLPHSTTTLLRESMASVVAGGNNPMCQ